jgi:hypothetical protein
MNFKRLLYTDFGQTIISVILGLGLATLFRKACKDRNCIAFEAPPIDDLKNKIYKYDNKCYKFNLEAQKCNKEKKMVEF